MKKNKIYPLMFLFISCFIISASAEEIKLSPLDYNHFAVKAVLAYQKALKTGDIEAIRRRETAKMRELLGERNLVLDSAFAEAELSGMRFISDKRIWVEAYSPAVPLKGFYLIMEGGRWRYARLNLYTAKAKEELRFISAAVKAYYEKNNRLPQELSDLTGPVPVDLFSDSQANYNYKAINERAYKLYSLGPDSDDDQARLEYSWQRQAISDGDIILSGEVGNE